MSTLHNAPYHHGTLRQSLLEAALTILARDGEAGLSLRDLARAVGVSPAAPYRHFDGRVALLEALAVTGFQRFDARMKAVATGEGDPLPAMGRAYVLFALENANLFHLMFSPQLRRDQRPGLSMAADMAFATLRDAMAAGPEGRIAALGAWAKVHGLATLLLDGQIRLGAGERAETLVDAILGAELPQAR
jgi:AcrR family transcriptional regulator